MRILVIGYGNPSRRDDGVGLAVVNKLRQRLGLGALDETADGFDDLGGPLDTLFLQQLTPELAETLVAYQHVVFVDAHLNSADPELVRHTSLGPNEDPALVSHHFRPGRLLALAQALYGTAPTAELVSICGFDFDFDTTLSPATARGVDIAAADIWQRYHP
jgi:hydrogenase maturation protease